MTRRRGGAGRAAAALGAALCLALCPGFGPARPAVAQQFDNFDGDAFEGFQLDLDPDAAGDLPVPSLSDEALPETEGPDIQLDLDGRPDADIGLRTFPGTGRPVTSVTQPATETGQRVTLRALDKTLGRPTDVDLAIGETVIFGRIAIRAVECRYPVENPNSDAYAHLEIADIQGNPLFDAWMIASSPALSALEHPRYDVWVLDCRAQ
jgi:hypothetical protein